MLNLWNSEGWKSPSFNSPSQTTGHYRFVFASDIQRAETKSWPYCAQQLPTFVLTTYWITFCTEVLVSPGKPLLSARAVPDSTRAHTVSHRCIPREDSERSSRLLLVLRNMKRPMRRAGIAANEQTVGGWLLPHTSAAGGPREGTDE